MDEIGLFGFSISTIANLAVAAGTFALAIGTYLSIRTNQQEKERPVVLEFINSHLKTIKSDIIHDIWVLNANEIYWQRDFSKDYRDSLVFPSHPEKKFHLEFNKDILPRFLQKNYYLPNYFLTKKLNKISNELQKRQQLHITIEKNLEIILNDLAFPVLNQLLESSFITGPEIIDSFRLEREVNSQTFEEFVVVKPLIGNDRKAIPMAEFMDDVKSLIVISLFRTQSRQDNRLHKRQYPVSDYNLKVVVEKIKSILSKLENDPMTNSKKIIDSALSELKLIDEKILNEIELTQKNLQEKYLFTDEEIK